jgi:hypothetical protein
VAALREALLAVNRPTAPFTVRDGAAEKWINLSPDWSMASYIQMISRIATGNSDRTVFINHSHLFNINHR